MKLVVLGLSITSSWGNGHATTWRALLREFAARGHEVTFLERNVPWYAENRDMPTAPWARILLYNDRLELERVHRDEIRQADAVITGSYVPEGIAVGQWVQETAGGVTAFYDIDTPITLQALESGNCEYLNEELIRAYDVYFSFTGGPVLDCLEEKWGSPCARPLYCAVDLQSYFPESTAPRWDLGYLGTWSEDRQPGLQALLLEPARAWPEGKFVVAGPQYPEQLVWPENVLRIDHLPPPQHREFYNGQRCTLNLTRAAMRTAGWSPSVRLFEAAACGIPILSDEWDGLEFFFEPGSEILTVRDTPDVLAILRGSDPAQLRRVGAAARRKVQQFHSAAVRAEALERDLIVARCQAPLQVSPNFR